MSSKYCVEVIATREVTSSTRECALSLVVCVRVCVCVRIPHRRPALVMFYRLLHNTHSIVYSVVYSVVYTCIVPSAPSVNHTGV